jgi:hypothetical protein
MDKKIYKIYCEYYLYADSEEEAINFIACEDNLVESHFIIEEVDEKDVDEADIYNKEEYNKNG